MKTENNKLSLSLKELPTLNWNKFPVPADRAKAVMEGYMAPIRAMHKDEVVKSVGAMIALCAEIYCGMQQSKMLPETIQEATRLVWKHYKNLGVSEIREAFSLAAANKFDGVNMTAYSGIFTVSMLGDILTAYSNYRNQIIAKAFEMQAEAISKEAEEADRERKNQEARQKIYDDIEQAIIEVQTGEKCRWESWHDVPVHYAEIAVKSGWVDVSPEFKKSVWEKAKQLAITELSSAANDFSNFSEAKQARLKLRATIESKAVPDESTRIYSKLLIFEYVKMHEL